MNILVITDLHYVGVAEHKCDHANRITSLGPLLVRKALRKLQGEGIAPDAAIVIGDIVDNGKANGAQQDVEAVAAELAEADIPVYAVGGNHDTDAASVAAAFGCDTNTFYRLEDKVFVLLCDDVAEGDLTTRPPEGFTLLESVVAQNPGADIIALQHNPVYPDIESNYPYMPTNVGEIKESYEKSGVKLSLSGHYHCGQEMSENNGVLYRTTPAACEAPFRFDCVTLDEGKPQVETHALKMDIEGLVDNHLHTQYAYCATTVHAEKDIEVAKLMGLAGVTLTEHAFHLYFDREEAWGYEWQSDLDMVKRAYAEGRGRMIEYRDYVSPLRSDYVRLGLEVDLCADGGLLLAPEDADGWDLFVGAVHDIPSTKDVALTAGKAEKMFLDATEKLLQCPIQVLAHPFRWFRRAKLPTPASLFAPVADMLAQAGVAAEINYHTNDPDVRFIGECLSRNVKISLGTDSHDLAEVGDLHRHVALLQRAGVKREQIPEILYIP